MIGAKRRRGHQGVFALFTHLDSTVEACKALRAAGHKGFRAYAPLPEHELLEEGLALKHSPVRVFTMAGGLTGAATGFAFTSWTSMDWPLVTGGKPILSIPAYVIIAFECAILFGALSTVIGLFINAGLPNLRPLVAYHPECSNGSFGVYVTAPAARIEEAREILAGFDPDELREDPEGFDV
ncbi:MAG: DUF3341 domain-containing protein [Gemmatimonadetes bacterium]|nr:DUF3341 domain-containing protein [Gemmatimonadota bacterium]